MGSLKRICQLAGCSEYVDYPARYCPKHQQIQAKYDATRQYQYDHSIRLKRDVKYHSFYTSGEWVQLSETVKRNYKGLCLWSYYHDCKIVFCNEVHHIVPIKEDWGKRLQMNNLIPLSHAAHMQIEALYRKGNIEISRVLQEYVVRWQKEFGRGGYEKVQGNSADTT